MAFGIEGLHYATGVSRIESNLSALPGVLTAVANQATEQVRVEYVPGLVTAQELERAVEKAGFTVAEPVAAEDPVERERLKRRAEVRQLALKFAVAAVAAVLTMVGSMPLMGVMGAKEHDLFMRLVQPLNEALGNLLPSLYAFAELNPVGLKLVLMLLTLPVLFWSGWQFYRGAWSGFKHRSAEPARRSSTRRLPPSCHGCSSERDSPPTSTSRR